MIHVGGTHELLWRITQQFTSEGFPIDFIETRYYVFQEQKPFVLKKVFSHSWLRHM